MTFAIKNEKQNTMSFLDVQIIRRQIIPSTYKFDTVYTLAYRCLRICSSWTKLHTELVFLKQISLKNGCPGNFVNKCFKRFMDNIHVVKEATPTVEIQSSVVVFPYLGSISLQTRTKLKKSLKNILNCCKTEVVFKNNTRLGNNFHFKDWIPQKTYL